MKDNIIDLQRIKEDLRAGYSSVPTKTDVWHFTRGEGFVDAHVPPTGVITVRDEKISRDRDSQLRLKTAINRGIVESILRQVAANLGYGLRQSMDATWAFVTPRDMENTISLTLAEGAVAVTAYASEPDRMWIAGSNVPVTNLSVKNLEKHVRKAMAASILENREGAARRAFERSLDDLKHSIKEGLRAMGVRSDKKTDIRFVDADKHEDGTLHMEFGFRTASLDATFTVDGNIETILKEAARKVAILKTV